MKKKLLSAILLSGVTLGPLLQATQLVNAADFDAKIAAKDSVIASLTKEQAAAKAQVSSVQAQVSALEAQQAELTAENERLQEESTVLSQEISALAEKIIARTASLENQARSAQKNNTATSYISTIVNSESVSDAISRVVAIREVVSANEKMLAQQESDKEAIEKKQKANQEAINTVWENQAVLQDTAIQLTTQKAALEVAELNLAAELATAEGEKASLLNAKAEAEAVARAAAEAEAAARAKAKAEAEAQAASIASTKSSVVARPTVSPVASTTQTAPVSTTPSAPVTASVVVESKPVTPAVVAQSRPAETPTAPISQPEPVVTPTAPAAQPEPVVTPVSTAVTSASATANVNTAGNTYPIGQCTWGVKSLAPWAGNYWGNANQWGANAQAAGHSIGNVPVPGAIAVWPAGSLGHVAYVTAVEGNNKIQVLESNYAGNMSIGNYRGWFDPTSPMWGGSVYYIYP
ncbi:CHAP domain-containing protein [Streptococcus fryi]